MSKMLTVVSLCLIAIEAQSNELDNLINASSAIVGQIDRGIKLAGAGYAYANTGGSLSTVNWPETPISAQSN